MFWLPSIIFAVLCILAGLTVLILPETVKKPLPMNLEEMYKILYPKLYEKRNGRMKVDNSINVEHVQRVSGV